MIKGKIDKDGSLWLGRGGKLKQQCCAFEGQYDCSDVCPLFGEPQRTLNSSGRAYFSKLNLCRKTWTFEEADFEDERDMA